MKFPRFAVCKKLMWSEVASSKKGLPTLRVTETDGVKASRNSCTCFMRQQDMVPLVT